MGITGECRFAGDVDCVKFSLTGNSEIAGSLKAEEIKLTGECGVRGRIDALSLKGRGELAADAGLRAERLAFEGHIGVKGDCEAGELRLTGAVEIGGLLSGEQLDIGLIGYSRAGDVGGGKIRIKRSKGYLLLKMVKPSQEACFEGRTIEGDHVELEHVSAETVRGGNVVIGPGCEIKTVEYRESLEIHKSAKVDNRVKL
ncbi:cytoskeletal protein CcmA (bactofilin family) [Paenibacillus forsythiae]|uniref:Cytoskeletal protein CcmA (Bactofilin family) n=1 Tax=Paenibacillus forsythiae TaxID=365616 RepID=A0ABU3H7C4_9BACL|nr:hypothetical protein [Paenibacillus forsythiae]MDT3426729.1 cytoskeletal protein CcmA (bactofilin family) [Paenibacillus forsythiae]